MEKQVVIVSAIRTPIGAFQGCFKNIPCTELGGYAIKWCINKLDNFDKGMVDQVIMGCVLSAGLGQSPARQSSIKSGLSDAIPCTNINKVCGSGMYSVMLARNSILLKESNFVVAGGMENMSLSPYILKNARSGYRLGHGTILDHMFHDGLEDAFSNSSMGLLAERAAKEYSLSREDQDAYAKKSFEKVFSAYANGIFEREIIPVTVKNKNETIEISKDESPFKVNLDKIQTLKPAFSPDGTITAANASSIADGASALLLTSEKIANNLKIEPLARIVSQACFAHSPSLFATAPINAVKMVLEKAQWSIDEVDLFEINEAFAVVAMSAMKALIIPEEKINIYGGACALGHPLGASGARIIVTLLNALKTTKKKKGVATLCVGGGEGVAIAIEAY